MPQTTEPTRPGSCATTRERKPSRHNDEPTRCHGRSHMPQRRSRVPQLRPNATKKLNKFKKKRGKEGREGGRKEGRKEKKWVKIQLGGGFPRGAVVESLPASAGDTGSSPGLGGSHMPRSNWAREPQLLSPRVWSPCSATRGHDSERPAHRDEEWSPLATAGGSPPEGRGQRPNTAKINK